MTLPASYSTVGDVLARYPAIGSVTVINSAHIAQAIGAEQARINGMLGSRYAIPFAPTPPLIEMICGDLACMRMVETRVLIVQQTKGATEWTETWRSSLALLQQIADGTTAIVSASGTVVPQLPGATTAGVVTGPLWISGPGEGFIYQPPAFVGQDFLDERTADEVVIDEGWP